MKLQTVKGMNDYLPKDAELRDYLESKILDVYTKQGFRRIYTPIVEDIENLEKSDGGENLNLIFKILKRGEKLEKALENKNFSELSDMGLRYDLTLPLSRFFACHKNDITLPFKTIQIGSVYRAERPQKGRDREFKQCDIDVLGSSSNKCEIELIDTTARALIGIGIDDFVIKINDRRLLKNMLKSFGFKDEELDSICITFDKLDKIGVEGVEKELRDKGFDINKVNKFCENLTKLPRDPEEYVSLFGETEETKNLKEIIDAIGVLSKDKYQIKFDLTLVRGQGYYTGTVFEIESKSFSCSIGGGGRYDNLIGKFTGESVPAVGFSIGFERIFSILRDKNIKTDKKKVAVIYNDTNFIESLEYQKVLQNEYITGLFEKPKKLGKLLFKLENEGYFGFVLLENGKEIKELKGQEE